MDMHEAGESAGGYVMTTMTTEEEEAKRRRQEQHYATLGEIQDMARQLPMHFQQRLPYTTLSSLALSLLDGTVFEIVQHLAEIQHMTERRLMEQRARLHNTHKSQKQQLQKKQQEALQDCQSRPHNAPLVRSTSEREMQALEKKIQEEQRRLDERILAELDTCVGEQQTTLERAGVPGFHRTRDPTECRLQMHLLEFITRLRGQAEGSGAVG